MRNVVKGFQVSKLAIPKMHMAQLNSDMQRLHSTAPRRPPAMEKALSATRPGKNPGIRKGYQV